MYKFFFNYIFGKNSEFLKVIKGNKNKNAAQDFCDFLVGRERASKQFFFGLTVFLIV